MYAHEHDAAEVTAAQRPKAEPGAAVPDALLLKAAAAGRADAVGGPALLRLQRAVGNAAVGAALEEPSPVHDVVSSGGHPLDPEVRGDMEARLGHDFGDVRVHTDAAAHASAKAVNAHAYTVGSHVVFQRDAYDPGSHAGRTTLAHELTHVVQQRSGPVDGEPATGGIRVSDPADRFEREAAATAEQAVARPAADPAPAAVQRTEDGAGGAPAGAVQREEAEGEQTEEGTAG